MNEEEKAIEFLKNKTTNYSLSGEELNYYLILYYLIINLQKENKKLKEKTEKLEKANKEAIEYINKTEYSDIVGLNSNSIKEFWFVRELLEILDKGE